MLPAPPPAIIAAAPAQAPVSAPGEIGLVDADGRPFTLAELRGRWVWLYLGFASCPDACPRTLGEVVGAYAGLPANAPVRPVFVSVDPMRDTPARLKAYVGFFHPALLGASGPHGALDALVAALGTRYHVPPGARPDQAYQVAHPDEVFVLDPDGRYVGRLDARSPDLQARLAGEFALPLAAFRARAAMPPAPAPPPSTSAAWCGLPDAAALADPDPLRDPRMHRGAALGSGTSVLPGASPMRMWAWIWMAHLNAAAGAHVPLVPGLPKGFGVENWQKLMGTRYWGPGLADFRVMTGLEPWTLPAEGLAQPLQGGTGHGGLDLRRAHHPLTELAGRYTWTPTAFFSAYAYGGLAGEPALGPGATMHRPSAADWPGLPLAAHVLEAGHGAHGVVTLGARLGDFQLEGSRFNARTPDAAAPSLALGPLDSVAARLSWFPGRNLVAQVSYGVLSAMHGHPGEARRLTASALSVFATPLGRWSAALTWGQADDGLAAGPSRAWGLESQLDRAGRQHFYGRAEWLTGPAWPGAAAGGVGAVTLGYAHDLGAIDRVAIALGADVTAYPGANEAVYGALPTLWRAYLRLRPPTLTHPDDRNPEADGP